MKILFTSPANRTHYYPLVPLAWALRTAGHEVRIAARPELTDTITQTGLTAVPLQWSIGELSEPGVPGPVRSDDAGHEQNPDAAAGPWEWQYQDLLGLQKARIAAQMGGLNNDRMIDELVAFARHWQPDLVIWESSAIAGAVAARACGGAHARLVSGPDVWMQVRQTFLAATQALPEPLREDPTGEWVRSTLERLGCDAGFSEDLLTGQWTIDAAPARTRLDLGLATLPVQFVPYNGPMLVPSWLHTPAERPRVCLALDIDGDETALTLSALIASMGEVDAEIVVPLHAELPGDLGPVPANVRVVDLVPMDDLLPTCAVVVHRGAIATAAAAELYTVPQIVLTPGRDTGVMGAALEQAGAGICLPLTGLTANDLREHVVKVIHDPSFAQGARRLRDEAVGEPTPNEIVPELERLVALHRPQ